mmetsp:Transcript_73049/g.152543  ORF Transcript_73049/g.152543 Transcript_73049/m.152543 type:complete len:220 (-) Transcript_73049:1250-1909(-)
MAAKEEPKTKRPASPGLEATALRAPSTRSGHHVRLARSALGGQRSRRLAKPLPERSVLSRQCRHPGVLAQSDTSVRAARQTRPLAPFSLATSVRLHRPRTRVPCAQLGRGVLEALLSTWNARPNRAASAPQALPPLPEAPARSVFSVPGPPPTRLRARPRWACTVLHKRSPSTARSARWGISVLVGRQIRSLATVSLGSSVRSDGKRQRQKIRCLARLA